MHLFIWITYSPYPHTHQMGHSWAFKGVASQGCRAGSNPAVKPGEIPCISLSLQVLRCHLGKSQRFQPPLAGEKIPLALEKGVFCRPGSPDTDRLEGGRELSADPDERGRGAFLGYPRPPGWKLRLGARIRRGGKGRGQAVVARSPGA